jgi:acetylglutamate kinase
VNNQDVLVRLLTNIGSRKEVEQYLRHYASVDAPKFAVVKASGAVIENALPALASSLSFLQKVGLVPIVVHGGRWPEGKKTTPAVLEVARRVLHDTNHRLVDALESLGTRARPFTSGIFEAKRTDAKEEGLLGDITSVRESSLTACAQSGILPVVAPLGETTKGQILVLSRDAATRAVTLAVKPHKIVYLNEQGGLVDAKGVMRTAVNLAEDYEGLLADPAICADTREKLVAIATLLGELPPTSSVSITSPEHLAKELFTHRGDGTLVRRGETVQLHDGWGSIDGPRLRTLLEACFAKRLDDGYFLAKRPYRVYLAESYRATAILTLEDGVPYLDKFAVTNEAQGEGIGGSIWKRLRRENPKLFWRAKATNPVNGWYAQNADGLYKTDNWWVFWCGMTDFREIERSVTTALATPATFHETPQ